MAQKPLKGVGGVLGSLISPAPEPAEIPEPESKPTQVVLPAEEKNTEVPEPSARAEASDKPRQTVTGRTQARRGRPPGRKAGEAVDKEKVTLRLSKELMDDYRDWSWEERCQLGELVERAMTQYRKQRSRQKSQ